MNKVPNAAQFVLTVASLFHSPGWQAVERRRFATYGLRVETHQAKASELIDSLRVALSLSGDEPVWRDAMQQFFHFASIFDTYALHVATHGAPARQVFWAIGADVAGAAGRTWGFWCLDEKILPDLPGGDLWFLPKPDADDPERLVLPVEVIARWWADQLDGPRENIWADLYSEDGEPLEAHRTFQPWVMGRATPDIKSVERLFDGAQVFAYKPEVVAPPSTQTVRRLMLFARSLEQGWKDLVAVLTPGVSPHDPDPMRNKALQLAELFRLGFLFTFASGKGNTNVADGLFKQAIPEWLQQGPFKSILPNAKEQLPVAEEVAATLTERLCLMDPEAELPDIFGDSRMVSAVSARPECKMAQVRTELRTLLQKGYDAWGSQSRNRAIEVRKILSRLRKHPHADQVKADIHYLAALDALARGDLDDAAVHLKDGLTACADGSFGPVEFALARLSFGFQVSAAPFSRNVTEKYFRIFSRSLAPDEAERWCLGQAPLEYAMRLAAVEAAEDFPRSCRPYPGSARRHPMQESAEMFGELFDLMLSGADDNAIRVFKRTHKRALTAKLRDVRGDTVFTMLTKMMRDIVRSMQDMIPFDYMRGPDHLPTAAEMSDCLRQTYLRFIRQLPVDHLSAQDYLGQTSLMLAADQKDEELMALLLECGVETDQQDLLGRTALHSSVKSRSYACFELLLDHGANPKIQTCEGKTPLVMAAEFGRAQFVERLLSDVIPKPGGRELDEAHTLADRNSRNYARALAAYREKGVELDSREKFTDVIDQLKERSESAI